MVKTSSLVLTALVISLAFSLTMPFKIIQIIGYSIFLVIVFSFIYSKILVKNLKVVRTISELKLACEEQSEITFSIRNYSILPVFILYYSDSAPFLHVYDNKNSGIISLRPRELRSLKYKVSAQNRGLYIVGPVKIKTSDPLGLFVIETELESELKITVRPARIKLTTKTFPGFPQGNLKILNPIYEDITMRRSIREYQNGDEQKRINWRLSAKFGELFTNEYEQSYDSPFFVFLNLAQDDYEFHTRSYHTEKAIEIAATIVEAARKYKQRCGFAAYGTNFPYLKPKQNQVDVILDLLSLIQPVEGKLNYDPEKKFKTQLPSGTIIFVVGPNEVLKYFAKLDSEIAELNTDNLMIARNPSKILERKK